MLKQRVITAAVLLMILLPALFYSNALPFSAAALVLVAASAWEMGRLNGCTHSFSALLAIICGLLCGSSWYLGMLERPLSLFWMLAGCSWVLAGAWLLRKGVPGWPLIPKTLRLLGGLFVLWLAWLAAAQARMVGINFLLSVLLLVWVADIFAYFAGRAFGTRFSKTRLAPSISPGKSWEGVWGGVVGVISLSLVWVSFDTNSSGILSKSLYTHLWTQYGAGVMLVCVIFLTAASVAGDLVESLIKRSAGAKDSSGLLPGHGGVLDRIDALLPTLPLAMMLATF